MVSSLTMCYVAALMGKVHDSCKAVKFGESRVTSNTRAATAKPKTIDAPETSFQPKILNTETAALANLDLIESKVSTFFNSYIKSNK